MLHTIWIKALIVPHLAGLIMTPHLTCASFHQAYEVRWVGYARNMTTMDRDGDGIACEGMRKTNHTKQ